MASDGRKTPAKKTAAKAGVSKPKAKSSLKAAKKGDGTADVKTWLAAVKPEHRALAKRIDGLIGKAIPGIQRHVKWRKPSQPLGVPFYGLPGQGWLMALWSFKDYITVGLYARGLGPQPPEPIVNGRGIKIHDPAQFDDAQLKSWLEQSRELPGWGAGSPEFK